MSMLEQMVETRSWKVTRGLIEDGECRLCRKQNETTVEHLLAGCKKIANSEYLKRHNRALMVMAVAWPKKYHLVKKEVKWYKERRTRGHVLENARAKLVWDFKFNLRKMTAARRPDLILEDKEKKYSWMCGMACPQEINVEEKRNEKQTKYRQLAFELRERRVGYNIVVVPLVIGALGGGVKETIQQIERIFGKGDWGKRIVGEMQKTILMDSKSIIRKVLSGLVQTGTH